MLTWGRSTDASLFVDSDLSFVLFRLPIVCDCPVWWGICGSDSEVLLTCRRRAGKINSEDGRQSGVSQALPKRNKNGANQLATTCPLPQLDPLLQNGFCPSRIPQKGTLFLYKMRVLYLLTIVD